MLYRNGIFGGFFAVSAYVEKVVFEPGLSGLFI
jgi:hypothetical protein